jgi:hypothetical protein
VSVGNAEEKLKEVKLVGVDVKAVNSEKPGVHHMQPSIQFDSTKM